MDGLFELSKQPLKSISMVAQSSKTNGSQSTSTYEQLDICRYIWSRLVLQFGKDTYSLLLIDPIVYSVRWVSNLNSRNNDESYLLFKESIENRQSIIIPYRVVQNTAARIAYLQSSTQSKKKKREKNLP